MPSRREVEALGRAFRELSKRAQADLVRVFDSLDWSDATTAKQVLVDAVVDISNTYGDAAGAVAAQWVETLLGVEPVLPDRVVREQVEKRVGWSIARVFAGDVEQARDTTMQVVDHIVSSQGKETVAETCRRRGVRFARVPKGPTTCEFCLILASRGFVYESARTAGSVSRFHTSCDCQIVPEDGAVPDGYDPKALYEQWKVISDGPSSEWDLSKFSPVRGATPGKLNDESDIEYRQRLMRSLKSDFNDIPQNEPIEVHEFEFVSRLEALGHRVKWLPRDAKARKATNDFIWLTSQEQACELKCTTGKYSTIKSHIRRAVVSSRGNLLGDETGKQAKDVFVVDLGELRMTEKLRSQLQKYNRRVVDATIRRLFVMSSDGRVLEEIRLLK